MRHQRPVRYPLAFLTVAVGLAAAPGVTKAEDGADPVGPADGATATPTSAPPSLASPADDDPAPAPPTTEERPAAETTEPPADPEPPATAPDETDPPATTGPTPTRPEPTPRPSDDTPAPRPSTPAPPTELEERPTEPTPDEDELERDAFEALPDGIVRPISFPVLGAVSYSNGWGACRDGCSRRHVGTDIIGVRMQPLLAAVDGTVTRIRHENVGTAGAVITVTGADGWRYNYFHVNNDTPGTYDGLSGPEYQISPLITLGSTVRAGQVIAYMGDSGNAEGSVPHLHFEIRTPEGTPINPFPSLVAAQERQTCAPGEAQISLTADARTRSADVVAVIPIDGGGRWLIDRDGRLFADGAAALVPGVPGIDCATIAPSPAPLAPQGFNAAPAPLGAPAPVVAAPAGAPVATPWTVQTGQSLWGISQDFYGVSDVGATGSLVKLVFETNQDELNDPDALEVGMTLQLPSLGF